MKRTTSAPTWFGILRSTDWICSTCQQQARQAYRRQLHNVSRATTFSRGQTTARLDIRQHNAKRNVTSASSPIAGLTRKPILPDGPARTRFAPSPTGDLHIGGLRTALFSYLLAKRTGGQFLVRIEDTDQKRLVAGAEERLLENLEWVGLQWDEGPKAGGPYGPYKQSERNDIYQQHANELLNAGSAYRCFCTPQARTQGSAKFVLSGCSQNCSSLSSEESQDRAFDNKQPFTVKIQRAKPDPKRVYPDLIYGKIQPLKQNVAANLSDGDDEVSVSVADVILMKSDGTPTYHFANVVDDHLMKITHVIRGSEWMASTPLHYDLYSAFGWQPPLFAHVGLLVDENKAKLSKRSAHLALDVRNMRAEHDVLPETLVNFLALLGWSNPTRNDVFDMQGLIEHFDLKLTKGNTMVKFDKLWFLQKQHVARRCEKVRSTGDRSSLASLVDRIVEEVVLRFPQVKERFPEDEKLRDYCEDILLADGKMFQTVKQFVERNRYFFSSERRTDPEYLDGTRLTRNVDIVLSVLVHAAEREGLFGRGGPMDSNSIEKKHRLHAEVMRYLRQGLCNGLPGPSIGIVMAILGHREVLRRLQIEPKVGEGRYLEPPCDAEGSMQAA
ncbi:hypothetical protein BAUCODRAFT_105756 [Baudoinia panamericana UAMH 10762]|uniref:Glutamate--tRNA ligase, mitochondrial n=1 Tax=Baudoinia panamericana (strain UAMH 10762) TaxID=717646 RepID=M2LV05_BAUPA|nr:uncharacterized protein BAUCODRAFT_105756 [Baudoinia panamericana UAMH 10762]EMC98447.1 hypothetical protein BAUCODRAFT_105756 [Baudoinia panamericana UAMH 10762]